MSSCDLVCTLSIIVLVLLALKIIVKFVKPSLFARLDHRQLEQVRQHLEKGGLFEWAPTVLNKRGKEIAVDYVRRIHSHIEAVEACSSFVQYVNRLKGDVDRTLEKEKINLADSMVYTVSKLFHKDDDPPEKGAKDVLYAQLRLSQEIAAVLYPDPI